MRKSRQLAFILAAQLCGVPLVAQGQTPPAGRTPANPDRASNANADDEEGDGEEEDEDPTAPATPAGGRRAAVGDAETPPAPADGQSEPAVPETDAERRTRTLPRYSTLDGSIGLLHTSTAETGSAGSFRFGLMSEYYGGSEFLRPLGLPGTPGVGGADDARHIGSTLTLSYSPLDFLEVYSSIRAYANSNNRERPGLFQVLGDTNLGVKAAFRVSRGIYLGGDASAYLLNRSGDIGLLLNSTSFHLRGLASLDLKEFVRSVPLRFHVNFQYYFDNSNSIVTDTEARRQAAQPGFNPAICSSPATAADPRCHLEVSRVERFALGINRVDHFAINLGVEANLPWVRPFLEWRVAVPVNRQSYQCFDAGSSRGPGGATDDDGCLANNGFSAVPSHLTLGARVVPPVVRGLSGTLAFDIATSGSSTFVRELAPTTPWMFFFGAAFAYDTHPEERRVEVPGPARIETREVDHTPAGGHVLGQVRDAEAHTAVANAIVTFTGHPDFSILATGADGNFRSGRIAPGEYRLRVQAPEFNPGECTVTVVAASTPAPAGEVSSAGTPGTPESSPSSTPVPTPVPTPAPAPASSGPTVETEATVTCELRAVPRRGGIAGRVVSSRGGAGVANVTVVIEPAPGFTVPQGQSAPSAQNVTSDADGRFTLTELFAGSYSVSAHTSDQHLPVVAQNVTVEPRQNASVDLTATRRPAVASARIVGNLIAITRQVHFQTNSSEILPDSNTLIEELADVINRATNVATVEIQGHTDNQGVPATNQTLSQSRAESVRSALIRHGVSADRLTARGFGHTRPLRPNLTVLGRAANRRVEFHITRAPR